MNKKIIWLRVAYWTAAIADFLVAVSVLIPGRMGVAHYVYPMGLMSAVAFSWGSMLIIADRQPLERRWVLVPTILVVSLLVVVQVFAGISGLVPTPRVIGTTIATVVVLAILTFSYINTRANHVSGEGV